MIALWSTAWAADALPAGCRAREGGLECSDARVRGVVWEGGPAPEVAVAGLLLAFEGGADARVVSSEPLELSFGGASRPVLREVLETSAQRATVFRWQQDAVGAAVCIPSAPDPVARCAELLDAFYRTAPSLASVAGSVCGPGGGHVSSCLDGSWRDGGRVSEPVAAVSVRAVEDFLGLPFRDARERVRQDFVGCTVEGTATTCLRIDDGRERVWIGLVPAPAEAPFVFCGAPSAHRGVPAACAGTLIVP